MNQERFEVRPRIALVLPMASDEPSARKTQHVNFIQDRIGMTKFIDTGPGNGHLGFLTVDSLTNTVDLGYPDRPFPLPPGEDHAEISFTSRTAARNPLTRLQP